MEEKVVILTAPSGSGKTTIARHLLASFPELAFSISATTRPIRAGETDGHDYYFLSQEAFRRAVEEGAFVEWEEVYPGKYYGTLLREVERLWQLGKVIIFDVDVLGALNLKRHFGDKALALFVQPPSVEVLEDRLRGRATESADMLAERLARAHMEMEYARKFDKVLINDDLTVAKAQAVAWVANFLGGSVL